MPTRRRPLVATCVRHILAGNGRETTQETPLDLPRRRRPYTPPAETPVSLLMSRDVVCVRDDTSVEAVRALMLARDLGGAPVVDEEGIPRGFVSKTDLVRALGEQDDADAGATLPYGFHYEDIPRALVREVMTPVVFALPMKASLAQAATLMATRGLQRLIVVDEDGAVVGLFTSMDVVRWVAHQCGAELPS